MQGDSQVILILISIVGCFLSLLLMVNAWFTRKTLEKINAVDLNLAILITKHDNTEERSRLNSKEVFSIRERLRTLEVETRQLNQFLKDQGVI